MSNSTAFPAGYSICILPPTKKGEKWFGYAKNDNHSPSMDGGDDPTPDKTRTHGRTAGECAEAVAAKLLKGI